MPNCNNIPIRIQLTQPCNPCNACSYCNRCACECTCDLPDYDTGGCITVQPSSCMTYDGPDIADQHIATGDTITKVIQNLAAFLNGTTFLAPKPEFLDVDAKLSTFKDEHATKFDSLIQDVTLRSEGLQNKVEHLEEKIKKNGSIHNLKATGDDIVNAEFKGSKLNTSLNIDNFFLAFIEFIKADPVNASRLAQLINYVTNAKDEFVLYPYRVDITPANKALIIKWTAVDNVNTYSIYFKPITGGDFVKAGETPALGITIPNLDADTEYQVYIISNGTNGTQSEPTPIVTAKTI